MLQSLIIWCKVVEKVENVTGIIEGDDSSASKVILEMYPYWKCCNDVMYVFDDISEI